MGKGPWLLDTFASDSRKWLNITDRWLVIHFHVVPFFLRPLLPTHLVRLGTNFLDKSCTQQHEFSSVSLQLLQNICEQLVSKIRSYWKWNWTNYCVHQVHKQFYTEKANHLIQTHIQPIIAYCLPRANTTIGFMRWNDWDEWINVLKQVGEDQVSLVSRFTS